MTAILLFHARTPGDWAPVRYWLRRRGCRSVAVTFPALLEALRLSPELADRVRLLAPGASFASTAPRGWWSVTRLERS